MLDERRTSERFRGNLEATWEGVVSRQRGTLVDISLTGCFILTPDEVQQHELVRLEIEAPTNRTIYLWAEVVYKIPEMGFALCFTGADEKESDMLKLLLDYLREGQDDGVVPSSLQTVS